MKTLEQAMHRLRIEQRQVIDDILDDLEERSRKEAFANHVGELAIAMALSHKVARLIAVTADLVSRIEQMEEA